MDGDDANESLFGLPSPDATASFGGGSMDRSADDVQEAARAAIMAAPAVATDEHDTSVTTVSGATDASFVVVTPAPTATPVRRTVKEGNLLKRCSRRSPKSRYSYKAGDDPE